MSLKRREWTRCGTKFDAAAYAWSRGAKSLVRARLKLRQAFVFDPDLSPFSTVVVHNHAPASCFAAASMLLANADVYHLRWVNEWSPSLSILWSDAAASKTWAW